MQKHVDNMLNQNYKIINEINEFLNRNILELSDESDDYLTVVNNAEKMHYSNWMNELCSTRQKLIKYTYDIYRGKRTNYDIINITKCRNGNYNLYFRTVRHSFKTIFEIKNFLNLSTKYEIVSLELKNEFPIERDELVELVELVKLSKI